MADIMSDIRPIAADIRLLDVPTYTTDIRHFDHGQIRNLIYVS